MFSSALCWADVTIASGNPSSSNGIENKLSTNAMYDGNKTAPIPFKRLSDEKHFPFLQFGSPPRKELSSYDNYAKSISRYPDIRSCLENSEKKETSPDLGKFDWKAMENEFDVEVCMFRLLSSIANVERSKKWLELQGFNIDDERELSEAESIDGNMISHMAVIVQWSMDNYKGRPLDNLLQEWLMERASHAVSIGMRFSRDEEVTQVGLVFNSL